MTESNIRRQAFEAMVAHLHDAHGLTAEAMAEDEVANGTEPAIVAHIRAMSREDALERLPYHYFMGTNVARDEPAALRSAAITHQEECAALGIECDFPPSANVRRRRGSE